MRPLQLLLGILFFLIPLVLCAEDYYKTLGLDKSASEKDIKRAYRTLSKRFHPDKNPYVFLAALHCIMRYNLLNERHG